MKIVKQDYYELSLQAAMKRFCSYDMSTLSRKAGIIDRGECFETSFFGLETIICKKTGAVTVDGQPADFCEALSVFDWLCDGKPDAKASGEFCPVSSLPGVLVRGSGLVMKSQELADIIDAKPDRFKEIIQVMGGKIISSGDIGAQIDILPGISMQLKFYHSDEEFSADITFLWDKNILQFVRYETVYYIFGTLKKHLLRKMEAS